MSKGAPLSIADGVPTEPDVARLNAHFGKLEAGRRITYADIGGVINAPHGTVRWSTVTKAWRKGLESTGIFFRAENGAQFVVRDNTEKGVFVHKVGQSATRRYKRAVFISSHVDLKALPEEQRRQVEGVQATYAAFKLAQATCAKSLPPIP